MKTNLKGSLTCKRWLCALAVSALLVSASSALAGQTLNFTRNPNGGSYVNLRLSPSYSGIIADRIATGTAVDVLSSCGDWLYVSVSGNKGYIHENFISSGAAPASQTATITGGSLNLRAQAHTDAQILGIYPQGTQVTVLSRGDVWTNVLCGNVTGYMLSEYLSFSAAAPSAPVVSTANANATVSTRNGGRLNLRQDASTASAVLGSYANGSRVCVLTHGSTWCKVRAGSLVGYMKTAYLAFDDGGASTSTAVVNNPKASQVLNLREQPSISSRSLAQYQNGKQVTVLGVGSQWCRVRVDSQTGYMMTRYLTLYYGAESSEKTVTNVSSSYVNLRSGGSYDSSVLMQVKNGTPVTVLSPLGAWSHVRIGGMDGYMVSSFLK